MKGLNIRYFADVTNVLLMYVKNLCLGYLPR